MNKPVVVTLIILMLVIPVVKIPVTNVGSFCGTASSITGFEDYVKFDEAESIESINDNKEISFTFDSGVPYNGDDSYARESYIMNLEGEGSIEDFDIQVTVDFANTGSRFGQFAFVAGSY